VIGGNEAGMKLGEDVRADNAAVWRRADVGGVTGRLPRTAPLLAVETAGEDEDEPALRDKARWYLSHGVSVVWIVLPDRREVTRAAARRRVPGAAPATGSDSGRLR
jgi:hypothetical protein